MLSLNAEAASIKYDIYFQRWGHFYFPFEDWKWFKSQGLAESNLNPDAVSWCGARGVMQLMPGTAHELGVNRFDPESNIQGGIRYDKIQYSRFEDSADRRNLMFASYNAGPGWILKAIKMAESTEWPLVAGQLKNITGKHSAETISYVTRINKIYRDMN